MMLLALKILLITPCPVCGLKLPPLRIYDRQQLGGEIAALFFGDIAFQQYDILSHVDVLSELQKPPSLPFESYVHLMSTFSLFSVSWLLSSYWNDRLGYLPQKQSQLIDETMQLSVSSANCIILSFLLCHHLRPIVSSIYTSSTYT